MSEDFKLSDPHTNKEAIARDIAKTLVQYMRQHSIYPLEIYCEYNEVFVNRLLK